MQEKNYKKNLVRFLFGLIIIILFNAFLLNSWYGENAKESGNTKKASVNSDKKKRNSLNG